MQARRAAKIAVSAASYAMDRPYLYLLPGELAEQAHPGMRALVPFGAGNRPTEGVLLSVGAAPEQTEFPLKAVLNLLDDQPVLDEQALSLALWMRERLFCTVYEALRVMLPLGLYFALKQECVLAPGLDGEAALSRAETAGERRLLEILLANKGKISIEDLRIAFGDKSPTLPLRRLKQAGLVRLEAESSRHTGEKTEQLAVLAMEGAEALALLEGNRLRYPARYQAVELLSSMEQLPVKELCYFTGVSKATLKSLEKKGILRLEKREIYREPAFEPVLPAEPPTLSAQQQSAFEGLSALLEGEKAACALLYGVTGSGKTQVYIRLIHACLARGEGAIVLVPEIALTPQLLRLFRAQFGDTVAVLHSMLSDGQRYDQWKRARKGLARVVVGTRSAVFAPVQGLGLIILDEEQEYSYKSESAPRYHAREIAKYRCVQNAALLLLGSATPSVETMYHAKGGSAL